MSCQHTRELGEHLGKKCGRPMTDDGDRCDLCAARDTLVEKLRQESGGESPCKNLNCVLNGGACVLERPGNHAVFNGYCLVCLSVR